MLQSQSSISVQVQCLSSSKLLVNLQNLYKLIQNIEILMQILFFKVLKRFVEKVMLVFKFQAKPAKSLVLRACRLPVLRENITSKIISNMLCNVSPQIFSHFILKCHHDRSQGNGYVKPIYLLHTNFQYQLKVY